MESELKLLWCGIILIFILRILVWFKIKRILEVDKKSEMYEYFADWNSNKLSMFIPKKLNLKGDAKMWSRHFNTMTLIFWITFVLNFIFIVIDINMN